MTEQEILEGNKLIAKFMGAEIDENFARFLNYSNDSVSGRGYHIFELLYHSSWDWLMPVVEKIESLKEVESAFIIELNYCSIWVKDNLVFNTEEKTKIKSVYKTIIEFIKWHNIQ